jgi:hypothetical protein
LVKPKRAGTSLNDFLVPHIAWSKRNFLGTFLSYSYRGSFMPYRTQVRIPWHWLIWTGRVSRPRRLFPETKESSTVGWVYAWIVSVYLVFMLLPTNKIFSRILLLLKVLFLIGILLHSHGPPHCYGSPRKWQKRISLKHFFPGATFKIAVVGTSTVPSKYLTNFHLF